MRKSRRSTPVLWPQQDLLSESRQPVWGTSLWVSWDVLAIHHSEVLGCRWRIFLWQNRAELVILIRLQRLNGSEEHSIFTLRLSWTVYSAKFSKHHPSSHCSWKSPSIAMKSPGAHGPIAHRGIWGPIFLLQGAGVAALLSDALPVEAMRAVFPYWFGTWIWQNWHLEEKDIGI